MSEQYWKEEANSLKIQCSELEEKIKQLEAEKAEMIGLLSFIRDYLKQGRHSKLISAIYLKDIKDILKKHGVEI